MEFSSLNLLIMLMHVKVLDDWRYKSFNKLLQLFKRMFPMCGTTIPCSFYEEKWKLHDLDLRYETVHACKYDCVLYWKEFTDLKHCQPCDGCRHKVSPNRGKKICTRYSDTFCRHRYYRDCLYHERAPLKWDGRRINESKWKTCWDNLLM